VESVLLARDGTARPGVERMSLSDALALGAGVWDGLLARGATPSPFMSWAWHRAWADSASAQEVAATEVLVLRDPGGIVEAILPILPRRVPFHRVPVTALTWAIGDVGCPDHLDLLATPEADLDRLVPILEERPWQLMILTNLAPQAANVTRLCEALAGRGWVVRRRPLWACPYLELPDDWEPYLATLTPTRRQTLRRKERNLEKNHAVTITDYAGDDRLEEGWRLLLTLHERRWQAGGGGGGAFQEPAVVHLHRRFTAELSACGRLWLTTLDLDGVPAAAWYGFAAGDTVYFYQSGRDPRWERESVGLVLMGAMIRRAIERGFRRFDFLRGADGYKRHWTETQRSTEEITVFRPGWGGRGLRLLDTVAEVRARLRFRSQRPGAGGEGGTGGSDG
jgi:GNAT acetyltransferase-like protein